MQTGGWGRKEPGLGRWAGPGLFVCETINCSSLLFKLLLFGFSDWYSQIVCKCALCVHYVCTLGSLLTITL